jgi:ABC-type proline/glycine betaine transport system ATPase subunit
LLISEPAVTVDRDTENLIHEVMTENFKEQTLIFLATRFRAIVQMDRIMVMKQGQIVEFDTPLNLLDNPKSKFCLMVSQTGDVDPNYLRQLARKHSLDANYRSSVNNSQSSLPTSPTMPRSLRELYQPRTVSRSSEHGNSSSSLALSSKGAEPGDKSPSSQESSSNDQVSSPVIVAIPPKSDP